MKLFKAYIKKRRKAALVFLLFCIVFLASFALYRLPVGAVLYPALLCLLFGSVFILFDFSKAKTKHARLAEIKKLTAAMITAMPEIESIDDGDYQEIIKALQAEVLKLENSTAYRYRETVEYYTVWVHQIKTPIASMRLTLQNEDTPLSRKLSSDLLRIEQYAEMVLAFLRLDSASSDYVFREHDIDAIVKQAVAKFATEFIDRKIRFIYKPIGQTVVTDEKWLSFVIEQLLSNALKYTREGSIRICLRAPKTLCIEDTGIGIAPEDLPRIFEKGYTGYNGRMDRSASGIGLYLCKRICRNLGASLRVASEPSKGTAVMIDLDQYKLKKE